MRFLSAVLIGSRIAALTGFLTLCAGGCGGQGGTEGPSETSLKANQDASQAWTKYQQEQKAKKK